MLLHLLHNAEHTGHWPLCSHPIRGHLAGTTAIFFAGLHTPLPPHKVAQLKAPKPPELLSANIFFYFSFFPLFLLYYYYFGIGAKLTDKRNRRRGQLGLNGCVRPPVCAVLSYPWALQLLRRPSDRPSLRLLLGDSCSVAGLWRGWSGVEESSSDRQTLALTLKSKQLFTALFFTRFSWVLFGFNAIFPRLAPGCGLSGICCWVRGWFDCVSSFSGGEWVGGFA